MKPYKSAVADNSRWEGFQPRAGDIFVCTPPKCGTTWTQTIVANLIFPDGNLPAPVMMLSPWIEAKMMMPADEMHAHLAAQQHRRVMKSHTPADGIPWFDDARYIVVCRDGRDAFMSMQNHMARLKHKEQLNAQASKEDIPPLQTLDGDVHDQFAAWMENDELFFGFMASYWARKTEPNLLFVHYSDLKSDLEGEMRRIAAFLDIEIDEDLWPEVVERCTFEYMRNHDEMVGDMSIAFEGGTKGFIFKGTNGRWKNLLNADDIAAYQTRLETMLPKDAVAWIRRD